MMYEQPSYHKIISFKEEKTSTFKIKLCLVIKNKNL